MNVRNHKNEMWSSEIGRRDKYGVGREISRPG